MEEARPSNQDELLNIDEVRYSRQAYAIGFHEMRTLHKSRVLVSGLGGLGAEIAKNLAVLGVSSIVLHDNEQCLPSDLATQFFLNESSIGENRAAATIQSLSEINSHVGVRLFREEFDIDFSHFDIVVLTDSSLEEQLRISEVTHANNTPLIIASSRGVFGQIFCDFGQMFSSENKNGEDPSSFHIDGVTCDEKGVVTCLDDNKHGLEDGDFVTFTDIEGMTELNNCEPREVTVLSLDSFSIGDTSKFQPYIRGGICYQVKKPEDFDFLKLADALMQPEFVSFDTPNGSRSIQLHIAFITLYHFVKAYKRYPHPWSESDFDLFLKFCKETSKQWENEVLDMALLSAFSKTCSGNVCPINSVIGGLVTQQIICARTGRGTPIHQWMYFDAVECLPERPPNEKESKPSLSRYDAQIAALGKEIQYSLATLNFLVVGAGGIGCELLKNLTMMGVGVQNGSIRVTDMGLVDKSDLGKHQFFRDRHVGTSKAEAAAEMVMLLNPQVRVTPHYNRLGSENESFYDDAFYDSLSGMATAVDNIESRIYIDRQCVYYRVPLLECGSHGTKGSMQVIIPFLTECYSTSKDPTEKTFPMCTLKSFPNSVDHTIQWALDVFETCFRDDLLSASLFLKDQDAFNAFLSSPGVQPVEVLHSVTSNLHSSAVPKNYKDCVSWARHLWQDIYHNQIRQLLVSFPEDLVQSSGQPFWSGPKRCPVPLEFDEENDLHLKFVHYAANLRAQTYMINQEQDLQVTRYLLSEIHIPEFVPKSISAELIDLTDTYIKQARMVRNIPFPPVADVKIHPLTFDHDKIDNYHLDFIVAAAKLRAANYSIPATTRARAKLISGKIIPGIITTNSVVAGLACLELLKLAKSSNKRNSFKNSFLNVALPLLVFSEPQAPVQQFLYESDWSIWDRFEVQGDMTLRQFIEFFSANYELQVTMVTHGVSVLYCSFVPTSSTERRMNLKMSELVEEVSKKPLLPHVRALVFELSCTNLQNEDVEVPYVRYSLPTATRGAEA